ncbi:hypothetical protein [Bythopirellula polymerisocia]|nr:hypothetical protein [Bythopirellula polymerisocia]
MCPQIASHRLCRCVLHRRCWILSLLAVGTVLALPPQKSRALTGEAFTHVVAADFFAPTPDESADGPVTFESGIVELASFQAASSNVFTNWAGCCYSPAEEGHWSGNAQADLSVEVFQRGPGREGTVVIGSVLYDAVISAVRTDNFGSGTTGAWMNHFGEATVSVSTKLGGMWGYDIVQDNVLGNGVPEVTYDVSPPGYIPPRESAAASARTSYPNGYYPAPLIVYDGSLTDTTSLGFSFVEEDPWKIFHNKAGIDVAQDSWNFSASYTPLNSHGDWVDPADLAAELGFDSFNWESRVLSVPGSWAHNSILNDVTYNESGAPEVHFDTANGQWRNNADDSPVNGVATGTPMINLPPKSPLASTSTFVYETADGQVGWWDPRPEVTGIAHDASPLYYGIGEAPLPFGASIGYSDYKGQPVDAFLPGESLLLETELVGVLPSGGIVPSG